ncbi:sodium ABC transporter ATP-binding protein [Metabacillus litoralis]|uniref:Sodium ABC transporter ATP-binding protein n=2 Tax=Metabacillus TaxID=2675233 RepID=A0A179SQQ7_9BACI|nr:sodium ABC transporter ATP-binding protein [Metabacillus litoralis]QNF28196.1 ABC transporter ATP-binding protein [Metabacillus sp. KUDC1714]
MENIVEIRSLMKNRQNFKLNNINLDIKRGFITGLIGPNGAGKTSLIRCLMNLMHIDSGEIKLFGKTHLEATNEIKQKIGFVYDENYFYEDLSIEQNKRIVSMFYEKWDERSFYSYLERFQLPKHKRIKDLSKGMKMKFSLAIALSHHPVLIIMDEPTSGLDPVFRREFLDILLDIVQDEQKAIFFSTHMTKDLEQVADYIAFINNGELVFSDEKEVILDLYVLVKGHKKALEDIDSSNIIGLKETAVGFEGLLARQYQIKHDDLIHEKPTLEDIMYYTVRGNKHASTY